jgi:hypothetical protein
MKRWFTWRMLSAALVLSIVTSAIAVLVNLATGQQARLTYWLALSVGVIVNAIILSWVSYSTSPIGEAEQAARAERRRNLKDARRVKSQLQAVFKEPGWLLTLRNLYDNDASDASLQFPLAVLNNRPFPIWLDQTEPSDNLDAGLSWEEFQRIPPDDKYATWYNSADEPAKEYEDLLKKINEEHKFNGPCWALKRLQHDGTGYRIVGTPAWYFDSLVTSEHLDDELMEQLRFGPDREVTLANLGRRRFEHREESRSPILDGRRRAAALSVSATTIAPDKGGRGFNLWLTRRSIYVATHKDFYHLTPSGILAPFHGAEMWNKAEYSAKNSLLREYAEELFAYKHLERGRLDDGRRLNAENLNENPRIRSLLDATARSDVQLKYLGMSVNLLTLRPELHFLILIRNADWWRSEQAQAHREGYPLAFNWESDRFEPVPLGEDLVLPDLPNVFHPAEMVPNAAAGIALGVPAARYLIHGGTLDAIPTIRTLA